MLACQVVFRQVLIGAAQAVLPTNPIGSRGGKNVCEALDALPKLGREERPLLG
jgi:hypothetical protein